MRASGDYARLTELRLAEKKADGGKRLRQDREDLLGRHPTFKALKEAFCLWPVRVCVCPVAPVSGRG